MEKKEELYLNQNMKTYLMQFLTISDLMTLMNVSSEYRMIAKKRLNLDEEQLGFFRKYFALFKLLKAIESKSLYCNKYFDTIDLFNLNYPQDMQRTTIQYVLALFIDRNSAERPYYSMSLVYEESVLFHKGILEQLSHSKDILFFITGLEKVKEAFLAHLSPFIHKYSTKTEKIFIGMNYIAKLQPHKFPYVYVTNTNSEEILNYSHTFPNSFSIINHSPPSNDYLLTKLYYLNQDSLFEAYYHYLSDNHSYPNLRFLHFDLDKDLPFLKSINYSKISLVKISHYKSTQKHRETLWNILNHITTLRKIIFLPSCTLSYKSFIKFLSQLSAPFLIKIKLNIISCPKNYDLSCLKKFPYLEQCKIKDIINQFPSINYCISDILSKRNLELGDAMIMQMVKNYLRKPHRRLTFSFKNKDVYEYYMSKLLTNDEISARIKKVSCEFSSKVTIAPTYVTIIDTTLSRSYLKAKHATYIIVDWLMIDNEEYYNYILEMKPLVIEITNSPLDEDEDDDDEGAVYLFKEIPSLVILLTANQIIYVKIDKRIIRLN